MRLVKWWIRLDLLCNGMVGRRYWYDLLLLGAGYRIWLVELLVGVDCWVVFAGVCVYVLV